MTSKTGGLRGRFRGTEFKEYKDMGGSDPVALDAETVKAFCAALKDRFNDPTSGLGKAYLRLLVDEIKLDGNELVVRGSHRRLADAIGFMQKRKLGKVPSFVNVWRASGDGFGHWDSNSESGIPSA